MPAALLQCDSLRIAAHPGEAAPTLLELAALSIQPNERIALIGPSGIGKSTLLRGLVRLQPIAAARYRLGDDDALALTPRQLRRRVAYLPQVPVALSDSVLEDLRLTFTFHGPLPHDWKTKAEQTLLQVGLDREHWTTDPGRLSVGQRMRLALARTLLGEPQLLLLDEPFAPLDPASRDDLMLLLHGWSALPNHAVVAVLHDPGLATRFATTHWELSDRTTLRVTHAETGATSGGGHA